MPVLKPKLLRSLTEADYAAHAVWAIYDDRDELELLETLGFNPSQVVAALSNSATSEELAFPLPSAAATLPFHDLRLSVQVTLPSGTRLTGYSAAPCLGVFHKGSCYVFNQTIPDLSRLNAARLASQFGERSLFPLSAYYPATGKTELFDLP